MVATYNYHRVPPPRNFACAASLSLLIIVDAIAALLCTPDEKSGMVELSRPLRA